MREPGLLSALGLVGILSWFAPYAQPALGAAARAQAQPPPAVVTAPRKTDGFVDAFALLKQKQFDKAVSAFRQALEQEPDSARGYVGLAEAYNGLGDENNAIRACDKAMALTEDPLVQAGAFNTKGIALFARACAKSKPDRNDMASAEHQFRAALALDQSLHIARYNLGMLKLRDGADAAGVEWLSGYLAADPNGPMAASARSLVENPRLAREHLAPGFTFVTDKGERIDLAGLRGRVVLIDFWASWCGPCRMTIPFLYELAWKYRDRPFVLVSISVDRDAGAWRDAVAAEHMTWPQYHDATGTIAKRYDVRGLPTAVVIDGDGVVRDRLEGYDGGYTTRLESDIQKWLRPLKK